jgi:hypothetical protein
VRDDAIFYIFHRHIPTCRLLERRHSMIGNPARHDQLKVLQVGLHVERKAVARYPA